MDTNALRNWAAANLRIGSWSPLGEPSMSATRSLSTGPVDLSGLRRWALKMSFGLKVRKTLYKKLSFYVRNIPMVDALRRIQARYEKRKAPQAKLLQVWVHAMADGQSFSQAIEGWIPSNELVLIRASERSGDLAMGLEQAVTASEAIARARGAMFKLIEPVLLSTALIGLAAMFRLKMVPQFEKMLPLSAWSGNAKIMYSVSNFIVKDWYWLLIVVALIIAAIVKTMPTWVGERRAFMDRHIMPWSIFRMYQGAAFMVAVGGLLRSMAMREVLVIVRANANPWLRHHMDIMLSRLRAGENNMGRVMNTGLLDDDLSGDLEDFADIDAATFNKVVRESGDEVLEDSVQKISALAARMKVMMMIMVALGIASMYGTVYLLMAQIGVAQQTTASMPK